MNVNIYKSSEECNSRLAEYLIKEYLSKNKNIAISGGSTPIGLFTEILNQIDKKFEIKSNFFWVDERCVDPSSVDSNFGSANKHFFSKVNISNNNIFRIRGEEKPEIEASNYTELLKTKTETIKNIPSLDLCLLGIGGDGHTASIFPHELKKLSDKSDCVVGINPDSGQKRVSLSIKQINNSKEVIFHVCGSGKKDVVDMIICKRDNYLDLPASHVLPKSKNLSWYLDFDSAETFMGT